ncbi:hypothetical protein LV89_01829 [Arcicella aurantiaca]|uniref:Uncharacterized protein n=1 Tax=Arcicella aurantiaca TaxID=591202 RepID=A0A316E9G8_9BACT|nr:hypothetical protein LV89_01829 [Arcicella aurantiaca]
MLLFLTGCTQADYQRIDSIFGFTKSVKTNQSSEYYGIKPDTSVEFEPFNAKRFDSVKVAKKADSIKTRILSPQKTKREGWRSDPALNSAYEESKAFEKARRQLHEIYAENAKKAKEIKKSTAKDSTE